MYHNRVKDDPTSERVFYLITNRVVGGSFLFKNAEKEKLKKLLFEGEKRFAYKVWDYVIMDNHYHCVLEVYAKDEFSEKELLARYNHDRISPESAFPNERIKRNFAEKAHDISSIVGNFQQRFTQWFNKSYDRLGHLFGGRFDSEILDRSAGLMRAMAYLTLNPVRANIVKDPKDYHYCGYAQRLAQKNFPDFILFDLLRDRLCIAPDLWDLDAAMKSRYFADIFRAYLMGIPLKKGSHWTQESLGEFLEKQGEKKELAWNDKLMHRCAYFSHGIAKL